MKKCPRCGATENYPNGDCARCRSNPGTPGFMPARNSADSGVSRLVGVVLPLAAIVLVGAGCVGVVLWARG